MVCVYCYDDESVAMERRNQRALAVVVVRFGQQREDGYCKVEKGRWMKVLKVLQSLTSCEVGLRCCF